jgi:tight adherence protein C
MLGIYWLLYKPQSAATERLRRMGGKEGGMATAGVQAAAVMPDESPATDLAQRLANPLNKLLPPSATEARKTQRLLMQAGYRSPEASIIYRGIHVASMVGIPVITALVTTYFAKAFSTVIIAVMIAFVMGFFLPPFFLKRTISKRQRELRWGLADALDLMVISVEAGLGLNAAMMKVSSELKDVHQAVSYEFEIANLEIRVGRERDEALRNLAERTGVDDLRSLVAMLIQTD